MFEDCSPGPGHDSVELRVGFDTLPEVRLPVAPHLLELAHLRLLERKARSIGPPRLPSEHREELRIEVVVRERGLQRVRQPGRHPLRRRLVVVVFDDACPEPDARQKEQGRRDPHHQQAAEVVVVRHIREHGQRVRALQRKLDPVHAGLLFPNVEIDVEQGARRADEHRRVRFARVDPLPSLGPLPVAVPVRCVILLRHTPVRLPRTEAHRGQHQRHDGHARPTQLRNPAKDDRLRFRTGSR